MTMQEVHSSLTMYCTLQADYDHKVAHDHLVVSMCHKVTCARSPCGTCKVTCAHLGLMGGMPANEGLLQLTLPEGEPERALPDIQSAPLMPLHLAHVLLLISILAAIARLADWLHALLICSVKISCLSCFLASGMRTSASWHPSICWHCAAVTITSRHRCYH